MLSAHAWWLCAQQVPPVPHTNGLHLRTHPRILHGRSIWKMFPWRPKLGKLLPYLKRAPGWRVARQGRRLCSCTATNVALLFPVMWQASSHHNLTSGALKRYLDQVQSFWKVQNTGSLFTQLQPFSMNRLACHTFPEKDWDTTGPQVVSNIYI